MINTLDIQVQKVAQSRIDVMDFHNIDFAKQYSDHMFTADFQNGVWSNFQIVPYGNISLSPANPGLHYGQSIFEGLKAYKNSENEVLIFRPFENFKRMNISAERMMMPKLSEEIFMDGLRELLNLDRNWVPDVDGTALYIRPFMFATDEYIGVRPSTNFRFMIITCPVGAYYSRPVRVRIEEHYTRAAKGGVGFAKTAGNYAASLYPAYLAQQDGYDQLIWTDGQFHTQIEESGTMNIMFVIDDTLVTAPTGDTILNGITRDSVLTIAREWGMKVEVRPITVDELIKAIEAGRLKEAFGVGTAATITNIETIAFRGHDFDLDLSGSSFSGKVLKELNDYHYGRKEDKFGWNFIV